MRQMLVLFWMSAMLATACIEKDFDVPPVEDDAVELETNASITDVKEFYMGITQGGGRKSFKEVKSYKRRKRWM